MNQNLRKMTTSAQHEVSRAEADESAQMAAAAEFSAQQITGALEHQQAHEESNRRAKATALQALQRGEARNHALLHSLDENAWQSR